MKVCDICKCEGVKFDTYATISDKGGVKRLELCGKCYKEFEHREHRHKYLAYTETIEAMTGKIPSALSVWDKIDLWMKEITND